MVSDSGFVRSFGSRGQGVSSSGFGFVEVGFSLGTAPPVTVYIRGPIKGYYYTYYPTVTGAKLCLLKLEGQPCNWGWDIPAQAQDLGARLQVSCIPPPTHVPCTPISCSTLGILSGARCPPSPSTRAKPLP